MREEVRALVYGNRATVAGEGDADTLPESLLQLLSRQYVSRADLQVALSSLERSILQNIKLQLVQHRNEEVRETVPQTTGTAGDTVTPEVRGSQFQMDQVSSSPSFRVSGSDSVS